MASKNRFETLEENRFGGLEENRFKALETGPPPRVEGTAGITPGLTPDPTAPPTTAVVPSAAPPVVLPPTLERQPLTEPEPPWYHRLGDIWQQSIEGMAAAQEFDAKMQLGGAKLAGRAALLAAKQYNRPFNAMRVGLYWHYRETPVPSGDRIDPIRAVTTAQLERQERTEKRPVAESPLIKGLKAGWSYQDERSWPDVFNVAMVGPDMERHYNQWVDDHAALRIMRTADEFVSEVVIENAIEVAVGVAALQIPKKLILKTDLPGRVVARVAPKYTAEIVIDALKKRKPYVAGNMIDWLNDGIRRGPLPFKSADELIMDNLGRNIPEELATARTAAVTQELMQRAGKKGRKKVFAPEVTEAAMRQEQITMKQARRARLLDEFAEHADAEVLLDGKIVEAGGVLETLHNRPGLTSPNKVAAANHRLDSLFMDKAHLQDTLDLKWSKVETLRKEIDSLTEAGRPLINWFDISREIRTLYINDVVNAADDSARFARQAREVADAITGGRLSAQLGDGFKTTSYDELLPFLSDDEFLTIQDYVELWNKKPGMFQYEKKVKPRIFGKELKKPRRYMWLLGADVMTPMRWWFKRKGVPEIGNVLRQSTTDSMRHTMRVIDGWEDILTPLGGKNAIKNKDLMRDIWKVANGEPEEVLGKIKTGAISAKRGDDIIAAGDYINTVSDEIADTFEALGRWPTELKRENFYVRHLVDHAADTAEKDNVMLGRMADILERHTQTRIDISEFKNRIKHDLPLIENADVALRTSLFNSTYKLYMEPSFKKANIMAELTGDEMIIDHTRRLINNGIRGEASRLERQADKYVFTHLARAIERGSSWMPERFQFYAKERATRQLLGAYRRGVYAGAMGANPAPAIRNLTQELLNIPLTDTRSWFWGHQSMFTDGGKRLAKHCDLLVGRMPLEDFDPTTFSKIEKAGSKLFRAADKLNVVNGFNSNFVYLASRDTDALDVIRKYGNFQNPYKDVKGFTNAAADALDAGETKIRAIATLANDRTTLAQFDYTVVGQPMWMISGGPVTKAFGQFTTWWTNYYYGYLPELVKASISGVGPGGVTLGVFERNVYLRHFMAMEGLYLAGRTMGVDMSKHRAPGPRPSFPFVHIGGAAPTGVAPLANAVGGGLAYTIGFFADNETLKREGAYRWKRGWPMVPPVVVRKGAQILAGEKPPSYLLFKPLEKEKSSWPDRGPGQPGVPRIPRP